MTSHISKLQRADKNLHDALHNFKRTLNELFNVLEKFPGLAGDQALADSFNQLKDKLNAVSNLIDSIALQCDMAGQLPEVQASVLKSLDCPQPYVTKFVNPGYFSSIKRIREWITLHPAPGNYYLSLVTEHFRKNETSVYQIISQGVQPTNLEDLFQQIALRFAQPRQCQTLLTAVLTENGRLQDPVHSKGHAASCDAELKRAMTFQTVILECLSTREYYEQMYSGEVTR